MFPFLFGLARGDTLPGRALMTLAEDLGVPVPAARSRLVRFVANGGAEAETRGRNTYYRLAGASAAGYQRAADLHAPAGPWDGRFHAVHHDIPDHDSRFRRSLVRSALLHGFGELDGGLLISVRDRWTDLEPVTRRTPPGGRVVPMVLDVAPDHRRSLADAAWNLEVLATTFLHETAQIAQALASVDEPPRPGPQTVRDFAAAVRGAYGALVLDPRLPDELLPTPWPRDRLLAGIEAAKETYFEVCRDYVDQLVDAGTAGAG